MDAIKKKMLAMKMEKENAIDRAEQLEQKLRDTEEQKAKVLTKFCRASNLEKYTMFLLVVARTLPSKDYGFVETPTPPNPLRSLLIF